MKSGHSDKLIIFQLVKKLPAFHGIGKFITVVHKSPPQEPILSQLNPVHTLTPCFLKTAFPSITRSAK